MGYELYVKKENAKKLFEILASEGKKFNLSLCGMHAMDTMRMESGYVHWGHDISPEENQYQAGLNFAISFKKNTNFIGREVLEKIKDKNTEKKLKMIVLENSKPENHFCYMMSLYFLKIRLLEEPHQEIFHLILTKTLLLAILTPG